jgi:hypothetical protein
MFYQIDAALDDKIISADPEVVTFIEEALVAHRMSNLILVFSRTQMKLIESNLDFSLAARKTLALISQRSNDYRSAMALASRRIIICDDTKTVTFSIAGDTAFVNYKTLRNNHILTQSFFLCENLTDVQFYFILAKNFLAFGRYPENYVVMRPVAGGGSTTFQALYAEQALPLKGMVICDSDKLEPAPPFKHGSTAAKAFEAAIFLEACDCLGLSIKNPLFGFFTTPGFSIENVIGPNLLEVYFEANARHQERQVILKAFPHFPLMDEAEWILWQSLDLKNGTRTLTQQMSRLKDRYQVVPPAILARAKSYTTVKVPSDFFRWVVANHSSSRWVRPIADTFSWRQFR